MEQNKDRDIQNTIKTLQEKSEYIEKLLEKGNDVIIFQIGSHSIKYGFANEITPRRMRTVIGYRHTNPPKSEYAKKLEEVDLDSPLSNLESALRKKGNIKVDVRNFKVKQKSRIEVPASYKNAVRPESLNREDIFFEDDVYIPENLAEYTIRHPIRHGVFNISEGYTYEQVLADIQKIVYHILRNKLDVKQAEYSNYSIILVVPDIFHRHQVKGLINLFLRTFEFHALYLHQESVLATFGVCVSQACVVDIGSDKINICCVDEGAVMPQTLIRKHFGTRDTEALLYKLIQKKQNISYFTKNLKLDFGVPSDCNFLEKLKELAFNYIQVEELANNTFEGTLMRERPETVVVTSSEAFNIAPSSFYYAELLNAIKFRDTINEKYLNYTSRYFTDYVDIEDYDEFIQPTNLPLSNPVQVGAISAGAVQSTPSQGEGVASATKDPNAMDIVKDKKDTKKDKDKKEIVRLTNNELRELIDPFTMQSLDHLICFSISQIPEHEVRKKMANSILIVGGGSQIPNTVEELEDRLIYTISNYDNNIERVEVLNPLTIRETMPDAASWVGATVIQRVESMKELWITRARWLGEVEFESDEDSDGGEKRVKKDKSNEAGIKCLKEKIAFAW